MVPLSIVSSVLSILVPQGIKCIIFITCIGSSRYGIKCMKHNGNSKYCIKSMKYIGSSRYCIKCISCNHTSYLSRIPRIYPCKFFLAGVNFYRFNAKNWHFDRFYVKKWLFFTDLTRKIGVFRCKFYSPKILPV